MSAEKETIKDNPVWTGSFVARELGVRISSDPSGAVAVADLVGLALRHNPRRAHLLVSTVLAKHVPTEPLLVKAVGELLGVFVARSLGGLLPSRDSGDKGEALDVLLGSATTALTHALSSNGASRVLAIAKFAAQVERLRIEIPDAVVIGYAETATGLGRLVANSLGSYYIHSTRHATPGVVQATGFEEGHSHASSHRMVPTDPGWLDGSGPLVLVDDELSTGSTVINTIRSLHSMVHRPTYVVATLIDVRSAADRERFNALATELDSRIITATLGTGSIELGADIMDRAAEIISRVPAPPLVPTGTGRTSLLELTAQDIAPVRSDRFGSTEPPPAADMALVARRVAAFIEDNGCSGPVFVLGCEENIYFPLTVAEELAALRPDFDVRFSTTTRSPIVPINSADYAIADSLMFASHDNTVDGPGQRFVYNLQGMRARNGTIVVFPEPGVDADMIISGRPDAGLQGLMPALATAADDVLAVLLPANYPLPSLPAKDKQ